MDINENIVESLADSALDKLAGVPELLAQAMPNRGFSELSSVQRAVLDAESEGQDLRISSQTGSGKTVAIGFALARHLTTEASRAVSDRAGPSVLMLVPTRELAMQVKEELSWLFADLQGVDCEVVITPRWIQNASKLSLLLRFSTAANDF